MKVDMARLGCGGVVVAFAIGSLTRPAYGWLVFGAWGIICGFLAPYHHGSTDNDMEDYS